MRSKYEVRAEKELRDEGYIVDNKSGMSRWAKNRDFFNLFDLIAVKLGEPLRWISIKGLKGIYQSHAEEIKKFWLPPDNVKEIWARSSSKKRKHYWNKVIVS